MKTKDTLIHPEDSNNLHYWTKKWGVSVRQLNDAILDTGSVDSNRVKEYLKKDIWYYSPLTGFINLLRIKI